MAVEVAADVVELDEGRRLAAERLLAQLRRTPGETERAVDRFLVGRVGSGSSAATYAGEPVARRSAVPKRSAGRDDELDRDALDRDPDRAPLACSTTATICGS